MNGRIDRVFRGSGVSTTTGDLNDPVLITDYDYDDAGRPIAVSLTRSSNGGTLDQRVTRTIYDSTGRITTTGTDGDTRQEEREIDGAGRLIRVSHYSSAGSPRYTARAEYDAAGRLKRSLDPSDLATDYEHDGLGRITRRSDLTGVVSWEYFDETGIVVERKAGGVEIVRQYDRLGNLSDVDAGAFRFTYRYDARGNLLLETWTDGAGYSGRRSYTWNVYGEPTSMTQTVNGTSETITYQWDPNTGRLQQRAYSGITVQYTYDAFDQISEIQVGGSHSGTFGFDYHPDFGFLTRVQYPNGIRSEFTRNDLGELLAMKTFRSGESNSPFLSATLGLDERGKRDSIDFQQPSEVTMPNSTTNYSIDGSGRLTAMNGVSVGFDARGNITRIPAAGGDITLSYDAFDRVASVAGTAHHYDTARTRLLSDRGDGSRISWLQDPVASLPQIVASTDTAADGHDGIWIYGPGGLLGGIVDGQWRFPHPDYIGNISAVTDDQGIVKSEFGYTPFGQVALAEGETDFPFQFGGLIGVVSDPEGVVQMRARYYQPELRRFTSGDLIAGTLKRPMSLNRFSYVEGNVLGSIDPSGLEKQVSGHVFGPYATYGSVKKSNQLQDSRKFYGHSIQKRSVPEMELYPFAEHYLGATMVDGQWEVSFRKNGVAWFVARYLDIGENAKYGDFGQLERDIVSLVTLKALIPKFIKRGAFNLLKHKIELDEEDGNIFVASLASTIQKFTGIPTKQSKRRQSNLVEEFVIGEYVKFLNRKHPYYPLLP